MKAILSILLLGLTTGCLVSNALEYDAVVTNNLYHLARLRKGMTERQVIFIMRQPYSYETYQFDEDIYDVWFYVTQTTVLDQTRMVPQNLTPLSFKNGILVGTGYDYYYFITREDEKRYKASLPVVEPPPPVPIREPKELPPVGENNREGRAIEKVLGEPNPEASPEGEQVIPLPAERPQ